MKNIYVVTHTESIHHVQGLFGGWYDTSLTENGRDQAGKIAMALYTKIGRRDIPIYSSDLKRCTETADIFAKVFHGPVVFDRDLREMNFGEAGGKTKEWSYKYIIPFPAEGSRLDHRLFSNSESRREIGTRITNSLNRITDKPDDTVIIITHGFALTYVIKAWLKVPVESMGHCGFQTHSGGVTLLNEDDVFGNRRVMYVNRRNYLSGVCE